MIVNFFDLGYLASGTPIQQKGYAAILESGVMDILHDFNPVLAGTLPLDLFIEGSDLDILCCAPDLKQLENLWIKAFARFEHFTIHTKSINQTSSLIARFYFNGFWFELFAQPVATENQIAYRHLVNEYAILEKLGEGFRQKVIALKKRGIKTEPAFAQVLDLNGNPYEAILNYSPQIGFVELMLVMYL